MMGVNGFFWSISPTKSTVALVSFHFSMAYPPAAAIVETVASPPTIFATNFRMPRRRVG
jgi:hypothetical protein